MTRPHDRPADAFLAAMADVQRRLTILERAARVPQVTGVVEGSQSASISTAQSTTSTSFTDLATVGPKVDVVVPPSGTLLLYLTAIASGSLDSSHLGYELSGANVAAATEVAWGFSASGVRLWRLLHLAGLNPGPTTVTVKYRRTDGGGSGIDFADREVIAIPI